MNITKTYVAEVTQLTTYVGVTKIRAESPLDVVGKALKMVHFGDSRLEFEITEPRSFQYEYSVRVYENIPRVPAKETTKCGQPGCGEPIYAELSPSERRLNPDPLTMFEQLVEFVDRYPEELDTCYGIADPASDPDGWLTCFFEDLRLVRTVDSYRDLIPMKLRLMPALQALAASADHGAESGMTQGGRGQVLAFPSQKSEEPSDMENSK